MGQEKGEKRKENGEWVRKKKNRIRRRMRERERERDADRIGHLGREKMFLFFIFF
jgi:hypothetical protein